MFISEKLIFLELQKTGCTHIIEQLSKIIPGEIVGKHNRLPGKPERSDRYIIGSIRNPWDWYVSLWAFGCDNKGVLFRNVTRHRFLSGHKIREFPFRAIRSILRDVKKPVDSWKQTYRDSQDPELFRRWLTMILDPGRRYDPGEGYGYSSISTFAGFYTYRFLYLCSETKKSLFDGSIDNYDDLAAFYEKNNVLDFTIRNESLEDDLIKVLKMCNIHPTAEQIKELESAKRTNISSRKRDFSFYYDSDTAALVAEKEKFIIEQFGYQKPAL
ncbi:hypothetical protein ACFL6L_02885 [candidate division KSB1 bacterium]